MSEHMVSVNVSGVIEARFGWNAFPRQRSGGLVSGLLNSNTAVDCDARAVFCKEDGTPISQKLEDCCLFYGNRNMFSGAAVHQGDNQVGGSGDDEIIVLDLNKLPPYVEQVLLTMDIFKEKKRIGSGRIQEAFLRIVNQKSGDELAEYDFSNLHSGSKIVVAGRLLREESDGWKFLKEGESYKVIDMSDFISRLPQLSDY